MNSVKPKHSLLMRTIRFGATGLFVTALHILIATVLIHYGQLSASIANGIAFCVATTVSYLMHTKWSFSADLEGKNLFRFAVVSTIGLLLSLGIPLALSAMGFGAAAGTAAVVIMLPITNFVLHNFWTYR